MGKLVLFRRDTIRLVKWLDFDNHIYDEDWHRYYVLFGIFKFDLTFKETNDLDIANKFRVKPVSGFKNDKDDRK